MVYHGFKVVRCMDFTTIHRIKQQPVKLIERVTSCRWLPRQPLPSKRLRKAGARVSCHGQSGLFFWRSVGRIPVVELKLTRILIAMLCLSSKARVLGLVHRDVRWIWFSKALIGSISIQPQGVDTLHAAKWLGEVVWPS